MKINLILDRLIIYFQVDTLSALAKKLGVSATTLSNWRSRNTIDYELLFTKCEGISFDWLFLGRGKMLLVNYETEDNKTPFIMAEDPVIYKEIICAKDETIVAQKKYITLLESELKRFQKEEPGDIGQKRKAG